MEKRLVEADELSQWLTDEIRKEPGCQSCIVLQVCKTDELVDCNWSIAAFVSHNPDPETCANVFVKIQRLGAQQFNLM